MSYVRLCKHMDMYGSSAVARDQLFGCAKDIVTNFSPLM